MPQPKAARRCAEASGGRRRWHLLVDGENVIAQAPSRGFGGWEVTMNQKHRREFESLAGAAERTGMSTKTLRRRIASGVLAAYRSGPRLLRVEPDDVDQMMVRLPTVSPGADNLRVARPSR